MSKYRGNVERSTNLIKGRSILNAMNTARSRCKKFNREFTITTDQLIELRSNPCYYCEGELPPIGLGLDRIDNSKGYTVDNVLPCCTTCNRMRGNYVTSNEMKFLITVLKFYRECISPNQQGRLLNWLYIFR